MTTETYVRLYDSYASASSAVRALEAAGFSEDHVSVVSRQRDEDRHASDDTTGADTAGTAGGTGATLGTVVGGGAGLLAGIGLLAIPGIGPLVAAGWLVAALTGAGAGAAAGGLLGSLVGAGVDEADASVYTEGVNRGGTLVTVRADASRMGQARLIMDQHGPVDTKARASEYRANGWSGAATDGTTANPPGTVASRTADDVLGTNISGARPEHEQRNPPGTAASRGLDGVAGTNFSGARPENNPRR